MTYCRLGDPDLVILPPVPVSRVALSGKQIHKDIAPMMGRRGIKSKNDLILFYVPKELKDDMNLSHGVCLCLRLNMYNLLVFVAMVSIGWGVCS